MQFQLHRKKRISQKTVTSRYCLQKSCDVSFQKSTDVLQFRLWNHVYILACSSVGLFTVWMGADAALPTSTYVQILNVEQQISQVAPRAHCISMSKDN